MKKILRFLLAASMLGSLAACMVVPPHAEYIGPRIAVVAPYPAYPVYAQPYYVQPMRPYYRGWDRRW